jgi:hypothetical protein
MLMAGALVTNSERVADLTDRKQHGGTAHETENNRFRNVAGEIAELEHRDEDLDGADHGTEKEHRFCRFDARVRIEKGERAEHDEGNRAGRSVDEVR